MPEELEYTVLVWAGGRAAEGGHGLKTREEALETVERVMKSLGLARGQWLKLAPGVAVMSGPEGGGWCVVLARGLRHVEGAAEVPKEKGSRVKKAAAAAAAVQRGPVQ